MYRENTQGWRVQASLGLLTMRASTDAFFLITIMADKCTFTTIIAYYPHSNIPGEDIILIIHMETSSKRLNSLCHDKWEIMTSEYSRCPLQFVRIVCLQNTSRELRATHRQRRPKEQRKWSQPKLAFTPQTVILSALWFLYIGLNTRSRKAIKMTAISHFAVILATDLLSDTVSCRRSVLGRPQPHSRKTPIFLATT